MGLTTEANKSKKTNQKMKYLKEVRSFFFFLRILMKVVICDAKNFKFERHVFDACVY